MKQVLILSIAFALLFFGFDGVQQQVVAVMAGLGNKDLGYNTLLLIYVSFLVFDPIASYLVKKMGAKTAMLMGAITYPLFILTLKEMRETWIYGAAILVGMGAALLWTGQNTHLIQVSQKKLYGNHAGIFNALRTLGSGLGVMMFGVLLRNKIAFDNIINGYWWVIMMGVGGLLLIKKTPGQKVESHLTSLKATFTNITYFKLSMPFFLIMFLQGLILGYVPEKIGGQWGLQYVGLVTSLFFLIPLIGSWPSGKLSDRVGRLNIIRIAYLGIFIGISLFLINNLWWWIGGIVLLALASAVLNPASMAIVGDVADDKNREQVSAFFWFMRILGVVAALIIGKVIPSDSVILISLGVVTITTLFYRNYLTRRPYYEIAKTAS